MEINKKIKNIIQTKIPKLVLLEISILIFIGILTLTTPALNYSLKYDSISSVSLALINILILINICTILITNRTLESFIPIFISFIPIVIGVILVMQYKIHTSNDWLGMPLITIEKPFYGLGTSLIHLGILMLVVLSAFNLFKPIFLKSKSFKN